jgi:hypothetical protein
VQDIEYPGLTLRDGPGVNKLNVGRKCEHGVILKVVTTNICCSDQHMVRGRTTAFEQLPQLAVSKSPEVLASLLPWSPSLICRVYHPNLNSL